MNKNLKENHVTLQEIRGVGGKYFMMNIKDRIGKIITEEGQIIDKWRQYFK